MFPLRMEVGDFLQGAPSIQMHPVPSDWSFSHHVKPDELEDKNPDKRPVPLTKEGATKVEHPAEFANGRNTDKKSKKAVSREINCDLEGEPSVFEDFIVELEKTDQV